MILRSLENGTSEILLERLIEGQQFDRLPVDAIYAALSRAVAVASLLMNEMEDPRLVNALWSVEHEIRDAMAILAAATHKRPEVAE